jgi:1-acyl-sn-glycerol-3-phosphate acyltransferase
VPAAITGSDNLFAGGVPKPKRVQVAFAEPIPVDAIEASPEAAGELVEGILWPQVEGEFRRLRSRQGLIAAGVAALGVGGGFLVQRQRRKKQSRLPWRR